MLDSILNCSSHDCTLVAIARDEAPYIAEWLAFHLAIGFSQIMVFDHKSVDDTPVIVARAALAEPAISLHMVPASVETSPQIAAYTAALALVQTPWVAFFDIDEFLVPWRDGSLPAYLARVPGDVSTVHVNWRSFGSSGLNGSDYGTVVGAFTHCAPADWAYQAHYKTLARRDRLCGVQVHEVLVSEGRRTLSDFTDIPPDTVGIADRIVYDGIQLNHYQCKTWVEFAARMCLPSAGSPCGPRRHDLARRFSMLDRNEVEDQSAIRFKQATERYLLSISKPQNPSAGLSQAYNFGVDNKKSLNRFLS